MSHLLDDFDDAGDSGSTFRVADIRLHGTDRAELLLVGETLKRFLQAAYFDWVPECRTSAMRFDITDRFRLNPRVLPSFRNDMFLTLDTWCRKRRRMSSMQRR
ncbi:hypothetical protein P4V43_03665 [Brevibacillus fortis]|nr:hypothetical protein [Brevibacillus fortis]